MFPIGDDNSARRTVPFGHIRPDCSESIFFFAELSGGDALIEQWAFVPRRFCCKSGRGFADPLHVHVHARRVGPPLKATSFSCGFSVTMWKTVLGTSSSSLFYLVCGLAATAAQLAFSTRVQHSQLGSLWSDCRRAGCVHLDVPAGKGQRADGQRGDSYARPGGHWTLDHSAALSGMGSLATTAETGGVAYVAHGRHFGGFIAGFVLTFLLRGRRKHLAGARQ